MKYLLDTDWSLQALKGRPTAVRTLEQLVGGGVCVSRVTRCELYEGAFHTVDPDAALLSLRAFLSAYRTLEITDPVAEGFGALRAFLRRGGMRLADLDLLIAATALHNNLTLLTFNRRHFERVPGLRIYGP